MAGNVPISLNLNLCFLKSSGLTCLIIKPSRRGMNKGYLCIFPNGRDKNGNNLAPVLHFDFPWSHCKTS